MAIPVVCTMETDINGIGGLDDVIRQAGRTYGAKNQAGVSERLEDILLPPTAMAELDGIAAAPKWSGPGR